MEQSDLKSRQIFPLEERNRISSAKRANITLYMRNETSACQDLEMIDIKDYHKVVLALEACEQQLLELIGDTNK